MRLAPRLWNICLCISVLAAMAAGACGRISGDDPNHVQVSSQECVTCHRSDYQNASKPPHVGTMPETCGICHTQTEWAPAKFQHPWPLVGAHLDTGCASCHVGNPPVYKGTSRECVGCHQKDYDSSPYPGHQTFPTTCSDCHSTLAWKPASAVEHPFPLQGAHSVTPCASCHVGNPPVYKGTPTTCVGCHKADYDSSPYPGHQTFPTTCSDCHGTTAWKPASTVEHPFPLNGAHASTACGSCHVGNPPKYKGTPTTCVGCHKADYDSSPYPGHQTFPTTCSDCHATTAWKPASPVAHPFPLDGAHASAICGSCHVGNPPVYKGTPTACVGCHQSDYDSSPYPGHQAFPTTCNDCHNTAAWKPAAGGGHPESKFPITTGKHKNMPCADCHNSALGAQNGKANADCVGCHTGEHKKSKADSQHQGVKNYPTGSAPPNFCLDCHSNGKKN